MASDVVLLGSKRDLQVDIVDSILAGSSVTVNRPGAKAEYETCPRCSGSGKSGSEPCGPCKGRARYRAPVKRRVHRKVKATPPSATEMAFGGADAAETGRAIIRRFS